MFWHFLKVVYSRACESRGVWIKVRKLKIIRKLDKDARSTEFFVISGSMDPYGKFTVV